MSYPRNPNMPQLPNTNMSPYPYPSGPNQSMPMPSQPTQSGNQFGFVPPNVQNPNPLPYPSYPAQSAPLTYPQMPASQVSVPQNSNAFSNSTTAYPSMSHCPPNQSLNSSALPYSSHSNPSVYSNQSNLLNSSTYPNQSNTPVYPNQPYTTSYPGASQHNNPNPNMCAPHQPQIVAGHLQHCTCSIGVLRYYSTQPQGNAGHLQQTSSGSMYPNSMATNLSTKPKGNPTVVPIPNFDPSADAQVLRKAMKGFGTDEDAIINILCRRSNEQRQIIKATYKTHYGKDLVEDIRSETSKNFELLLVALLCPILEFYAKELHDAIYGIGTDEQTLIEILCSLSNSQLHSVRQTYTRLYRKNLEDDLKGDTSGHFRRLLISLCNANRDESGMVDHDAATRDAQSLYEAGAGRWGTDESTFNMVFCQRNLNQIKLIVEKYQQKSGHTLETAIKSEFSGHIEDGLLAVLRCAVNKNKFFARCLVKSMKGLGTNDNQLIRLIVTRCEVDLADIKTEFQRMNGKTLQSWIKGDTSGDYRKAL